MRIIVQIKKKRKLPQALLKEITEKLELLIKLSFWNELKHI